MQALLADELSQLLDHLDTEDAAHVAALGYRLGVVVATANAHKNRAALDAQREREKKFDPVIIFRAARERDIELPAGRADKSRLKGLIMREHKISERTFRTAYSAAVEEAERRRIRGKKRQNKT